MKKLYIFVATLAIVSANAQTGKNFVSHNKKQVQKEFVSQSKASDIRFNQTPNFEVGIISLIDQNQNQIFAADDFQISSRTKVAKLFFYGLQYYDDLPDAYLGLKIFIFNDDNGKPAGKPSSAMTSAVAVIDINSNNTSAIVSGTDSEFTFEIDVTQALGRDLILDANKKYWIAFAPKLELVDDYGSDADEIFYWALGNKNYSEPMLIDEADLFDEGVTNWTTISTLIEEPFDGLAFTITGDTALGTTEIYSNLRSVSIYPNPATDVINLKANKQNTITKAEIYDMSGKLVVSSTEKSINIAKLSKAVYLVKVYSGTEVIETSKIIKK